MFGQFREANGEHGQHDCRHRHRYGWWGDRGERWEAFAGGGRERFFDNGQLRLVILQLIADKPSYGYEIIKAIEERLSGGYAPSPGVVYPTLTLLEEEGLATVASQDGNKKLYTATEDGREHLKTNHATVEAILGRMQEANRRFGRGRNPQIVRAMTNLGFALRMRVERGDLSAEQFKKIAETLDAAARTIDSV